MTFNFEGGDILLYRYNLDTIVFVGISDSNAENEGASTTIEFATYLREYYSGKNYIIYPVFLDKSILHLDLVFNILPFGNRCILYPGGIEKTFRKEFNQYLSEVFTHVQSVTKKAADEYVCNFINTGPNAMIVSDSQSMRTLVRKWMTEYPGLKISLIKFNDVYENLAGSIRCSTLPIIRGDYSRMHITNEIDVLKVCMVGTLTPDKKTLTCLEAIGDIQTSDRQTMLGLIGEQLENLCTALQAHGVHVLRPDITKLAEVPACNVIFARDVLLIIGSRVFVSNLHLPHRKQEAEPYLSSIEKYFQTPSS